MALTIGTNVASLQASAAASSVNRDLETSMARLSTGKRINSAADDAAGVAIASRLSSEIRGTDQAIRNALDGKALIDTAEGGHKEIEEILQRMREVSIQAANDTNGAQDRDNLQAELKALITEIDRIAGVTTWAGNSVMDGGGSTSKTFSLQVGAATGTKNQIEVAINSMSKTALGLGPGGDKHGSTISALGTAVAAVGVAVDVATGVMTLDATKTTVYSATVEGQLVTGAANGTADSTKAHRDASAVDFAAKINADATLVGKGIKAVVMTDAAVVGSTVVGGGTASTVNIKSAAADNAITFTITGTNAKGEEISESLVGAATNGGTVTTTAVFTTVTGVSLSADASGDVEVGSGATADTRGDIVASAGLTAGNNEMTGVSANARVELLHGADDLSSFSKAMHAVTVIDAAILTVNTQRSELGAVSNRLTHTVSNMTNVSTNLSAARGGIEDADFALETTNLAKNQILQQASTAMLAQANASKQNVLSLLQ